MTKHGLYANHSFHCPGYPLPKPTDPKRDVWSLRMSQQLKALSSLLEDPTTPANDFGAWYVRRNTQILVAAH